MLNVTCINDKINFIYNFAQIVFLLHNLEVTTHLFSIYPDKYDLISFCIDKAYDWFATAIPASF